MSQTLPLVNFMIAGVQKGGTTALHSILSRHKSIKFASVKEPHFFDNESDTNWLNPNYDIYHSLFAVCDAKVFGEATPIYLYWPNCLERIQRYRPEMKFILLFREPVERAWSHWRMEYTRKFDKASFKWAIRDGRKRFEKAGHHRVFSYVERGLYGSQVSRILNIFPRNQLLFLSSHQLLYSCNEVMKEICDFLCIPAFTDPIEDIRHNVSPNKMQIDEEDKKYLRALYKEDTLLFNSLTGIHFDEIS